MDTNMFSSDSSQEECPGFQIHRSLYVWSLTNWQMSYRYECEHRCSIIFHSSLTRTSRRKQVLVFL